MAVSIFKQLSVVLVLLVVSKYIFVENTPTDGKLRQSLSSTKRQPTCDNSNPSRRVACGWSEISPSKCLEIGCCSDTSQSKYSPFFVSKGESSKPTGITKDDVDRLLKADTKALDAINLLRNRIKKAHKDHSISKTVGSSVSIGGAVATTTGIFLAPFSGGASLVLTVGGVTAGVLGGLTTLTTSIIQIFKTKQWQNELIAAFADEETELKRIAEKVVTFPEWHEWAQKGAGVTGSIVFKGMSAYTVATIGRYLAITNIKYGNTPIQLAAIKDILNPDFWKSIKYLRAAGDVKDVVMPGAFLAKESSTLNKFLVKIGLPTVQVGATTLKCISVAAAVATIGLDIYTIVDTWVNDPALIGQIDELILKLEKTHVELNDFKNDLKF